jgi:flagellar biosynthesis GTPase FlhF
MRRGALRSALSERLREGNLIVVDDLGFASPKTKDFINAIGALGLAEDSNQPKTLIVDSLDNANLILSSRNVPKTKVTNSFGVNIYDLIYHDKVVFSKAAIEELNELLDPVREGGKAEEAEVKPKAKKAAKKADGPVEAAETPKRPAKAKADDSGEEKAAKPKRTAKPKKDPKDSEAVNEESREAPENE